MDANNPKSWLLIVDGGNGERLRVNLWDMIESGRLTVRQAINRFRVVDICGDSEEARNGYPPVFQSPVLEIGTYTGPTPPASPFADDAQNEE